MKSTLHDALAAYRDQVIRTWVSLVQSTIAPASMPTVELIDHVPKFLDEVVADLRAAAGEPATAGSAPGETARGHGEQRLRLGFSLDAVVREYGALRDAIIATAFAAKVAPSFAELQCVFSSTITGIARAVAEYSRQRDAEQQRLHNEHIAFIAHELRNPLASAMMAHEVLTSQGHIPPDTRPAAALARGLTSMQELIDHALSIARSASGIELHRERVELAPLLAEVELMAEADAEARGVRLHTHREQDATLEVDRRLLRSALYNLVRNAVKYTARGTDVEVRSRLDGTHLVIEIEDACGGLPPGKIEAMFAPFVRLDTRTRETGSGLGLAIAKQAIEAHGGTIRVQNLPDTGCIFVVEIPTSASTI